VDHVLGFEINTIALELCVDQRAHAFIGPPGPARVDGWVRAASRHWDILGLSRLPPEPVDLRYIERAIEQSIAMADAVEDRHIKVV